MKVSLNSIVTISLILLCLFFGSMWYLKGSDYKKKLKESNLRIEKIEKVRDSLKSVNKKLEIDFKEIQINILEREKRIRKIENELSIVKKDLKRANINLENNKKSYNESKKRISELKKNPIKREGQDLINSLKEKLNKN
jgi:septal ring factor EnvC (AmiA/AmiB activator)